MQKQTFSAEALGNEYATGVSRPAVLTTKTFLPHQRVTTEGKAMACKCFTEVKERMVERVKEALGDTAHSMDECDFGNRVWVLEATIAR